MFDHYYSVSSHTNMGQCQRFQPSAVSVLRHVARSPLASDQQRTPRATPATPANARGYALDRAPCSPALPSHQPCTCPRARDAPPAPPDYGMRRRPRSRRQRGGDTGVRGNERLEIGTVQKDRLDELDAGSDGRRSKEFPSMPPSKPAQRETQSLAARSSSSAPSASSVPLLTTARSRCAA